MPKEYCLSCLGGRVSFLRVGWVRSLQVFGLRFTSAPDRMMVRIPLLLELVRLGTRYSALVCGGLWVHQKIESRVLSESCFRLLGYSRIGRSWQLACCGVLYTRQCKGWVLTVAGKDVLGKFKRG